MTDNIKKDAKVKIKKKGFGMLKRIGKFNEKDKIKSEIV